RIEIRPRDVPFSGDFSSTVFRMTQDGLAYAAWAEPGVGGGRYAGSFYRNRPYALSLTTLPVAPQGPTLVFAGQDPTTGAWSTRCSSGLDFPGSGAGAVLQAKVSLHGFSGQYRETRHEVFPGANLFDGSDCSADWDLTTAVEIESRWQARLGRETPPDYLPEGDVADPGKPAGKTVEYRLDARPNWAFEAAKLELGFATTRYPGIATNEPYSTPVPLPDVDDIAYSPPTGGQATAPSTAKWPGWIDPFHAGGAATDNVHGYFDTALTQYRTVTYDQTLAASVDPKITARSTDFGAKGFFAARWTPKYQSDTEYITLSGPVAAGDTTTRKVFQIPRDDDGDAFPQAAWLSFSGNPCPGQTLPLTPDADADCHTDRLNGKRPGDGLLAYDEYRGFVLPDVNGILSHERTAPWTKDAFVVYAKGKDSNTNVSADLKPGVNSFAVGAQVNLHARVNDKIRTELTGQEVIVNPYRTHPLAGAQRLLQVLLPLRIGNTAWRWGTTTIGNGVAHIDVERIRKDVVATPLSPQDAVTVNLTGNELTHSVGVDDHDDSPAPCPQTPICDQVTRGMPLASTLPEGDLCLLWRKASGEPCMQRDVIVFFYCAYQDNPSLPDYTKAMSRITDNLVCNSAQDHCRDEIDIRSW
ncbi:MAG: hypothetical protein HYV63_16985, partial [Candidatus Schekmanbacteria bacterium]|nr:hypothetical protein [Candidatus Schekmanbacteria bacterium]